MDILIQIILNSVIIGAIYSLITLGFNLIYGTARFFDIGYGSLIAVGGYATYFFYKILGLSIYEAILISVIISGLISVIVERLVYRPLRNRKASSTTTLVASLGVFTVIQAIIAILFSSQFQTLTQNTDNQKIFNVFGGVITQTQSIIFVTGIVIMLILAMVFKYSLFGKAVRAVSEDEEVSKIVGINTDKIIFVVFFIGGAIAALAGTAVGFDTGIEPTMGMSLLLKGVIAAIVGGIGNIYGGVLCAFFLAIIENTGAWYFSGEWKDTIAFVVLIIFLLFRPQGILGLKK